MESDIIRAYLHNHRRYGVVSALLLSGIYKLSTNPSYDLASESVIFNKLLHEHHIRTKRTFKDHFMSVMTGRDPVLHTLNLGALGRVLNDDGAFVSERTRKMVAENGRFDRFLAPKIL